MDLLERQDARRALAGWLDDARAGRGRVVLVAGEAGAGKTSLVRAFREDQRERVAFLVGACDPLGTPRPLGPLHDFAGALDASLASSLRGGVALYETFSRVLDALRAEPRVLVFEDVHWADEATLDLLRFLGRRMADVPALLLATYRDDEVAATRPLRLVLGDLAGAEAVRRPHVPLLSAEAVAAIAATHGLDGERLHRVTGNPFSVSEVVAGGPAALPETVRDAVLARAGRLPPDARHAADVASLVPSRAERWLLARAGAGDEAVDRAVEAGVLVADADGVRFRHELGRLAVESAVPPGRRRALHAALLEGLTEAGDVDAVLRHAPVAAERAAALGAHREAAQQLDRALRHAGDGGSAPARRARMRTLVA